MQVNNVNKSIAFNPFGLQNSVTLKGKLSESTGNAKKSTAIPITQKQSNILELSHDSQLISSKNAEGNTAQYKKSGVTSSREAWETDSVRIKKSSRYDELGNENFLYTMRMDEPETYAKFQELMDKNTYSNDDHYFREADALSMDWFRRRCMSTGDYISPVSQQSKIIDNLEEKYSDVFHDFSLNFYGKEGQDEEAGRKNQFNSFSLWRYSTKFNMLLSTDMLKQLSEGRTKEQEQLYEKIDEAVNNMKDVEKQYEGDKIFLRFGVKFHTDGNVTYHANYKDCKDSYGIQANSADELLKKLMSDQ